MALTQTDLDPLICSACGDPAHENGMLVLHARCHPQSGTFASYSKNTGVLTITCARCQREVCQIQVAAGRTANA